MATFTLTIEVDVEKFRDDPTAVVQRMMATAAFHLSDGRVEGNVRDVNGNAVGSYTLK